MVWRGPEPAQGVWGVELKAGAERHEVAVLALPHVVAFELGLPHRFLGGAVDADGRPLYRVRTCTVDGGPVRTSAHYTVLPDHDASILRTAATIVVPGIVGGPPVTESGRSPSRAPPPSTALNVSSAAGSCTTATRAWSPW